jgi:hypothetical protein
MVPTVGKVEIEGVVEFTNTSVALSGEPLLALFELYVMVRVHFAYKVTFPAD